MVEVRLPPLRERTGDLPLLVEHIAAALGPLDEEAARELRSPEFLSKLGDYDWPGNIRELRNFLERCVALSEFRPPQSNRPATSPQPAAAAPLSSRPLREAREEWTNNFERRYLEELLAAHDNRVSAAARAAGVDRIYFYRLLWKHGLRTREASNREVEAPADEAPRASVAVVPVLKPV